MGKQGNQSMKRRTKCAPARMQTELDKGQVGLMSWPGRWQGEGGDGGEDGRGHEGATGAGRLVVSGGGI